MLSFNNLVRKIGLSSCFLILTSVYMTNLHAQDVHEHLAKAEAIINQDIVFNLNSRSWELSLETVNKQLTFNLEENKDIFAGDASKYAQLILYKGAIEGLENSWARLSSVDGVLKGAFYDGEDLFFLEDYASVASIIDNNMVSGINQMLENTNITEQVATLLINAKDLTSTGTCALHDVTIGQQFDYSEYVEELVHLNAAGATNEIKISLVADEEFVASSATPSADMLTWLNIADGIFSEQVGIQISVTEVTELSDNGSLNTNVALNLISAFRNAGFDNPGVSHLFTGKDLSGSTVGIAYVGSLCRTTSVGVTQKYGSSTSTAIIFTHELGHNFGAPHDNQSGSACSSTPSGFVMNPSVNSGGLDFSACSIQQMAPTIDYAINGSGACITPIDSVDPVVAPVITSSPNLSATVGEAYYYDEDARVDVSGSDPITYSLELAPDNMSIDSNGLISWLPSNEPAGEYEVQIRVSNSAGEDTQYFTIELEGLQAAEYINFEELAISGFGTGDNQDVYSELSISDLGYQLNMVGNTWKSIPLNYEVTENTMIQFEFSSDNIGEIHGIALENDQNTSSDLSFNVHGVQNWGLMNYRYVANGDTQTFVIPVGQFYTGSFQRLVFIMDNDVADPISESTFSNVVVYEEGQPINPREPGEEPEPDYLNLATLNVEDFLPGVQDMFGTVNLVESGYGIELEGNKWQKIELNDQSLGLDTIISFDFKSEQIGEILGIGIYINDYVMRERTFNLHGTQDYGIRDYTYTGNGEWQRFEIPLGEHFTTGGGVLVLVADDDVDAVGNLSFKNIVITQN